MFLFYEFCLAVLAPVVLYENVVVFVAQEMFALGTDILPLKPFLVFFLFINAFVVEAAINTY